MADDLLPFDALTDRQRQVLRIVIQEYVETAQPVGSASIVSQYELGVSPATIRNELAALEKLGLLTHPHTSAGRVPTELGFRFFVRHLLAEPALAPVEQEAIRRQFSQARQEMDQWLRISTSVLARASHGAALATAPRSARCRFKHMELVHIHSTKVLLVLVLQEGAVKQQLLDLDEEMEQGELSRISNELNAHLQGCDAAASRRTRQACRPFRARWRCWWWTPCSGWTTRAAVRSSATGWPRCCACPSLPKARTCARSSRCWSSPTCWSRLPTSMRRANAVHVVIAGDGRYDELRDVSIVLARYGSGDRISGLLGVIGPVRMWYDRSIGAVRFVSDLMSEMVEDIYGS